MMTGTASRVPTYPTIPHMSVLPSACGLDSLAPLLRPTRLRHLSGPAHGQGIRGDVLGDGAPRGHVGALPHRHRRDQGRVASDEGAGLDPGRVLVGAVVVAGDRAGSDVDLRARWWRRPDRRGARPSIRRRGGSSSSRRSCPPWLRPPPGSPGGGGRRVRRWPPPPPRTRAAGSGRGPGPRADLGVHEAHEGTDHRARAHHGLPLQEHERAKGGPGFDLHLGSHERGARILDADAGWQTSASRARFPLAPRVVDDVEDHCSWTPPQALAARRPIRSQEAWG